MVDIMKLKDKLPANIFNELPFIVDKYRLNTPLRLSHFMAQAAHESGGFTVVFENLRYTSAESIAAIFKSDFDADKDRKINPVELSKASSLVRQPEKLANFVYANQNGNGNEASGDGWRHRGKGYIQVTGLTNQIAFAKSVGDLEVEKNTDLIATKYPLTSAAWFFADFAKLNDDADLGESEAVITQISKKINGGTNGLDDRIRRFKIFYSILK